MPFILFFIFIAQIEISILKNRKRLSKHNYLPMVLFVVLHIICTAIQFILGLPLLCVGIALSLVIIYFHIQSDIATIDYLTGLNNRRHLEEYLTNLLQKEDMVIGGIMIDLDDFKKINDKYGHLEGDHALGTMSGILRVLASKDDFMARYAGDEFVVLLPYANERQLEVFVRELRRKIDEVNKNAHKPYELKFSAGCAVHEAGDDETFDAFINRIDDLMYNNKKLRKRTKVDI